MNTPEIKQKAQAKIEELKEARESLARRYEKTQESHKFAAGMYGSELCGGDMLRQESDQLTEIQKLDTRIDLLKKVISDEFDLSKITDLNLQLGQIEVQMTPLKLRRAEIINECSILIHVSDLLR